MSFHDRTSSPEVARRRGAKAASRPTDESASPLQLLEDAMQTGMFGRLLLGRPDLVADELTAREREVFALIVHGASNKRIALDLGISLHTVKRHVANIIGKLGVRTRGEAVARWLSR